MSYDFDREMGIEETDLLSFECGTWDGRRREHMARALIIDNAVKSEIAKLREFAEKPENVHIPFSKVPGDDPQQRYEVNIPYGYRAVYTITKEVPSTRLYRHLSVSVNRPGKLPNVLAVWTIAAEFGFTGWYGKSFAVPADWIVGKDPSGIAITVAQLL